MNRPPLVVAAPCEARNTACPGAHACLYLSTGSWRICRGAILQSHDVPRSDEQSVRNGQELAA